ncbi:hypothetical protein HDC92_001605 [Pedobacter sp. AK017]|uniref:hypothetical protein n=1 Tax=Pedobacter sp. AK017 TaxID=2723073 RepID=UPI001613B2E8|nr:hypothetical protein [Pedobacter sp. AK017]MBB5437931.1 hypothetical protein [Pedobacter sp. AK017]
MDKCFVIQPFDNDKFDKRYDDIFSPAITKAGLKPYRIDQDLSVKIPIEDIEKGIADSIICFAEITTDNPNVWYELGYAIASGKDVILVCSNERQGPFPFDIRHRQIIRYNTGSTSDFNTLGEAITNKIIAFQQTEGKVKTLNQMPVVATEGLTSHEVALLILIMQSVLTPDDSIALYTLQSEMGKAGYTDIATSIAFRTLSKKDMIETFKDSDYNNNEYFCCRLTATGESWMLSNQNLFEFRKEKQSNAIVFQAPGEEDDLPF